MIHFRTEVFSAACMRLMTGVLAVGIAYSGNLPAGEVPPDGAPIDTTLYWQDADAFDAVGVAGLQITKQEDAQLDQYSSEGADDFHVSDPQGWVITRLNLKGFSDGAAGIHVPPDGMEIRFFNDNEGRPGEIPACARLVPPSAYPEFEVGTPWRMDTFVDLAPPCFLTPDRYWLAMQMVSTTPLLQEKRYYWVGGATQTDAMAVWRNPPGGYGMGCDDWTPLDACGFDEASRDFAFTLIGQVGNPPLFVGGFDHVFEPAAVVADRAEFLAMLSPGQFEDYLAHPPLDPAEYPSPHQFQFVGDGGFLYRVGTTSVYPDGCVPGPSDPVACPGGVVYLEDEGSYTITTRTGTDALIPSFHGVPVTAVGGNFWVRDEEFSPVTTTATIQFTVEYVDGTSESFFLEGSGSDRFAGFVAERPIARLSIDALDPDGPSPYWPAMSSVIMGQRQ